MGTHPIFESDFDCLTEFSVEELLRKMIGIIVGVTTYFVAPAALTAVGFTSAGVASGSLASMAQSMAYGGSTSGVFATLQSAGAKGMSTSTRLGASVVTGTAAEVLQPEEMKKTYYDSTNGSKP